MRRGILGATALFLCVAAPRAFAGDVGLYPFDAKGKVKAVRAIDTNGDGRLDLVVLVERREEGAAPATDLLVLRTPAAPAGKAFYGDADVTRIPCSGASAGARAAAGAVALGRFGPKGAFRFRFLGPTGVVEQMPDGSACPPREGEPPAAPLLARSGGAALVFWDGVADLDGDGVDECWYPAANGQMTAGDLSVVNEAQRTDATLFARKTTIPTLMPADLDGDGKKELLALEGTDLVVWRLKPGGRLERSERVPLLFLAPDPARPPTEMHTPRISLADIDGDGKVDLIVTLIQGRADQPGGLKTSLYHYRGPFWDAKTKALVEPLVRIDTESVALHPRFVDVDGDGKLDYVADSIRGNMVDLLKRIMGAEPVITYTAFRFVADKGTFEGAPYATFTRPYSSAVARKGEFQRSGFFEGDFDGDGVKDLLDLGNLTSVTILRGAKGPGAFVEPFLKPSPPLPGETFAPDAVLADLNGDGRADAALWSEKTLYLIVSRGSK